MLTLTTATYRRKFLLAYSSRERERIHNWREGTAAGGQGRELNKFYLQLQATSKVSELKVREDYKPRTQLPSPKGPLLPARLNHLKQHQLKLMENILIQTSTSTSQLLQTHGHIITQSALSPSLKSHSLYQSQHHSKVQSAF